MAVTHQAATQRAGRQFKGELYVAGVEGPEWLMEHQVWSLYLIGSKGNYRFYLTDRHITEQGVPTMGQRLQVTVKWAHFASQKLCFINAYEVVSG
ncbi:hypothetical protein QC823_14160 [Halomonas vilamensis]|uniref:Uncharacterized protein n=1 Tax=Vreelandella vilamensis TaxID=531309 RepID=A0ABU1H746_9GAMM|nr:hypothetical protein [Halomonas vilamensis]MDR5900125.1 hypothetical protein [Halomonas vilamensis]